MRSGMRQGSVERLRVQTADDLHQPDGALRERRRHGDGSAARVADVDRLEDVDVAARALERDRAARSKPPVRTHLGVDPHAARSVDGDDSSGTVAVRAQRPSDRDGSVGGDVDRTARGKLVLVEDRE